MNSTGNSANGPTPIPAIAIANAGDQRHDGGRAARRRTAGPPSRQSERTRTRSARCGSRRGPTSRTSAASSTNNASQQRDAFADAPPRPRDRPAVRPREDQRRRDHHAEPVAQPPQHELVGDASLRPCGRRRSTAPIASDRGDERARGSGDEREDDRDRERVRASDRTSARAGCGRRRSAGRSAAVASKRERPRIARDADEKRAEHDAGQQPVAADVGQRHGKPDRRPDRRDGSPAGGRRHDQLGEPPRDHRHERVGHDGAGEFVPGIPGAHCGGQIRKLGQRRKDYSARPI